jgi:dihydroneopterin aldolase
MDIIRIDALELDCIVGVRPRERRKRQPIRLDLALGLDLSAAGQTGRIAKTADYSRVADEVTSLLRYREYQLIEVATEELAAMLLGVHSMLEQVEVRLEKPAALQGRARAASVEIRRKQSDFPRRTERTGYGEIETLLSTHEATLALCHALPGLVMPPTGDERRHLEWVVAGNVSLDGTLLREGEPQFWGAARRASYDVLGTERATLFVCSWQ